MHLFVVYLHPLLEKILEICGNPYELVVAYTDDTSVIVTDDGKLDHIKQAFEDFAVLNISKHQHRNSTERRAYASLPQHQQLGQDSGNLIIQLGGTLLLLIRFITAVLTTRDGGT